MQKKYNKSLARRFRGLMPVVVDCETGGVNPQTDALLELAAVVLHYQDDELKPYKTYHYHVQPFPGANLDPQALEVITKKTSIPPPIHPTNYV